MASIGYSPAANARPAAGGVDTPNPLKGNRLCQRLRSPCAVFSWLSWASAPVRPLRRAATSPLSIHTQVSACQAVPCRSTAPRPPTPSSTQWDPPADPRSIPGALAERAAPILSPLAPLPRAWSRLAFPRPSTATILEPSCHHRRPGQSRAGSWPFPSSATPHPCGGATRHQLPQRHRRRHRRPSASRRRPHYHRP